MKRKVAFVLCVAMLVCMVSNALAAVKFSKFTMTFSDTTSYQSITSDTTSVAKAADTDYARLYVTATSSSKNNVYRTYSGTDYTSRCYYKKTTTGTWMYYNTDIDSDTQVYLMGRPDSSVPSCTVTGNLVRANNHQGAEESSAPYLRIWIDFHEFAGGYDEKI